jgi:predicted nucleic acid-binding protein
VGHLPDHRGRVRAGLANPAYGSVVARPSELVARLRKFCWSGHHEFWATTVSLRDETLFDLAFLGGHRQLTDVYLVGLAKATGGRLATFDRAIPLKAVKGATPEMLEIVSAAEAF